ncbi:TPA: hypothetical protein ACJXXT_000219 [Pseudomonas aeruginosa]
MMINEKEAALAEIETFKELVLAIKSNDYEAIANSKYFVDTLKSSGLYSEDGRKLPDFETLVYDSLVEMFENKSLANCTAYEIDKMIDPDLSECNEPHRFAKFGNEHKHYSRFNISSGEYITVEIILSNHGEFNMLIRNHNGEISNVDLGNSSISSRSLFYELADNATDYSDKEDDPYYLEKCIEEDLHYFNSSKLAEFDSKQEYLTYKVNKLIEAISTSIRLADEYDLDDYYTDDSRSFVTELLACKTESSYIILENELVIENNGSVCIIALDENRITVAQAGEAFDFRDQEYIAGPNILTTVDMNIYDVEDYQFNHNKVDAAQEIKKPRTIKPGR